MEVKPFACLLLVAIFFDTTQGAPTNSGTVDGYQAEDSAAPKTAA